MIVVQASLTAQTSAAAADQSPHAQEAATLLHFCEQLDQTSAHTVQGVRDRTDCWKRMQLEGMDDSTVDARYRGAVQDYDAAVRSDSAHQAGDSTSAAIDTRLAAVQGDIAAHRYADAQRVVAGVLAVDPTNQRALAARDRLAALVQARRYRDTLLRLGAAVLLLAIAFGALAPWLARRHGRDVQRRTADASKQQAVLEIVDGVGRGKMYTIDGPIFRIGSAESDKPEEKNHVVLSDGDAFISRYHCAIVRKEGKFFLIDSSLNGTYVDDELLARGEHRLLDDGAEFSLAGMTRIKFLMM
jgi:hypothetical protein